MPDDIMPSAAAPESASATASPPASPPIAPVPAPAAPPTAEAKAETAKTPVELEADKDGELLAVWNKHYPARGEGGRFVPPNGAESPAAEPAKPALEAPNSWTADMKQRFSSLPPDLAEYVAKREGEAHGQITRMGEQLKAVEPLAQILDSHKETFQRHQLPYSEGISRLLTVQRALDANPFQVIGNLMQMYGIDPASYASGQPTENSALLQQIANLQAQVSHLSNNAENEQRQREFSTQRSIAASIADFSKTHPDYLEIEAEMAAVVPFLRDRIPGIADKALLEQAYGLAQHMNEGARAKLEAAKQAKAQEEARKKAEAARRAGSINVKGGQAAETAKDNDTELREMALRLYGHL